MENIIEALLLCPIFKDLTQQEIEAIFREIQYTRYTYEKNEIIYHAGDSARHIAVIISGQIEIRKYLSSGNRLSVFQRAKGEMLGGSILFSSDPQYPCEVVAKEKSHLVFIEKSYVLQVFSQKPTIASNILRISANRIMQFEKRLELFSFYSIQKKIAFSLLHDFVCDAENTVVLPFTKTTWAEYLNVSRTSLSRELKNLCEQNVIKMNGSNIVLTQRELLESLLW